MIVKWIPDSTIKLKALLPNKALTLVPNQFVNVKVLITTLCDATVVNTAAVQHSSRGDYVYVLNPDTTVSRHYIKTGMIHADKTVVQTGLTLGQQVVVDGVEKVTPGVKVTVVGRKA